MGRFDLDMSYITDRLVAMSFPSQNMRSVYRNPLWQVKRVLDAKHGSHYKIYNLCAEEAYDPAYFYGRVEVIPFDDNHVPPLSLIKIFCQSVHAWLSADSQNVAVVHCMAGKGRTGLMVCAYLVYKGMPVEEALQLYADQRSYVNEGVTIASQRRYVHYWSKTFVFCNGNMACPEVHLPLAKCRELQRICLYDSVCSNAVQFVIQEIREKPGQLYQPAVVLERNYCEPVRRGNQRALSPRYYLSFLQKDGEEKTGDDELPHFVVQMDTESSSIYNKTCLDHSFDNPLSVKGDIRVIFYDKNGSRLFYTCFNTAFIVNSMLQVLQERNKASLKKRAGIWVSVCNRMQTPVDAGKTVAVALFDSLEGPENEEFVATARLEDDVLFYQTTSEVVANVFNIDTKAKRPALVLLKKEPEKISHFDGNFEKDATSNFIFPNKLPLVTTFTRESVASIFESAVKK